MIRTMIVVCIVSRPVGHTILPASAFTWLTNSPILGLAISIVPSFMRLSSRPDGLPPPPRQARLQAIVRPPSPSMSAKGGRKTAHLSEWAAFSRAPEPWQAIAAWHPRPGPGYRAMHAPTESWPGIFGSEPSGMARHAAPTSHASHRRNVISVSRCSGTVAKGPWCPGAGSNHLYEDFQ